MWSLKGEAVPEIKTKCFSVHMGTNFKTDLNLCKICLCSLNILHPALALETECFLLIPFLKYLQGIPVCLKWQMNGGYSILLHTYISGMVLKFFFTYIQWQFLWRILLVFILLLYSSYVLQFIKDNKLLPLWKPLLTIYKPFLNAALLGSGTSF